MPKKAVAIYFIAAFIGAVLFVFFTFPRTKDEIPKSNNQRPFPSAPAPGPDGVPVPETVPRPTPPKVPPGPTLRVMAWATGDEAKTLEAEADAFQAATGRSASLTIVNDQGVYRHDLRAALNSTTPPDLCLISSRDFSGLNPAVELADATPLAGTAPRSIAAFTVDGQIKAVPAEFSVEVLFYNPSFFDQAAIGYPARHWTWDILEADARALASLKLTNDAKESIYPLELPANFDLWNILCTETGHPALDLATWHMTEPLSQESQMRAFDLIHELFQQTEVTAPLPKAGQAPGQLFAQQRAALLIAPSEFAASLPNFHYGMTFLPSDISRASLARVNGWGVTSRSTQQEAAHTLAAYLAWKPVHTGWSSVQKPPDGDTPEAVCYEALGHAVIPRIEPRAEPLAQFLDHQIDLLARDPGQKTDALYSQVQNVYRSGMASPSSDDAQTEAAGLKPALQVPNGAQLRGF